MTPAGPLAKAGSNLGLQADPKMFLDLVKSPEDLPTQETRECYQQVVSNPSKIPSTAQMNYSVLEPLIFQSKTQTSEGVDGAFACGEGVKHS